MIKTLLLCVDGSPYSDAATDAALWLAKKLSARVQALSVVDERWLQGPWLADLSGATGAQPFQSLVPQLSEFFRQKAEVAAQKAATAARRAGVPCETETHSGSLVKSILAAELAAELVVLGQRGEGFEATGEWLGSNVERVVRKSIKPCLIVPPQFRPIRSILVAYDGSRHANHALYAAFDLARPLNDRLTILVVESAREQDEDKKSWALKEAMDLAAQQGVTAKALALHGLPEEKILEIASTQQHDLVVMGAYGHTRLRELVLGSVTHHVIRKSPVPVLLAR